MSPKVSNYFAVFFSLNLLSPTIWLSSQTVSDPDIDAATGFRNAILEVNNYCIPTTGNTINFTLGPSTSLSSSSGYNLPPIEIGNTNTLTISVANNVTFDGNNLTPAANASPFRGLFVNSGQVTLSGFLFSNLKAQGGSGGSGIGGGGGGLGAGGALFVGNGATLSLSNVSFSGNSAIGGMGGSSVAGVYAGGGGGGLGGSGGNAGSSSVNFAIGGGGGGLFGNGGSGGTGEGGGAAGGGLLGTGADGGNGSGNGGPGGGGGARPSSGGNGSSPTGATGGNGGNAENGTGGGAGGASGTIGATGGCDGGGGGGGSGANGGGGGYGGGGGGGAYSGGNGGVGGTGGMFGGGASGSLDLTMTSPANCSAGGGYGGGSAGGCAGASASQSPPPTAGFGGGGGGPYADLQLSFPTGQGGAGGFGGGGGGGWAAGGGANGGAGGTFGGTGGHAFAFGNIGGGGGGGGGALGGTIFVDQNGTVNWGTGITTGTSTVTGGTGGSGTHVGTSGGNGTTAGITIYLNTGSLLQFQNTDTQTLSGIDGPGSVEMNGSGTMALSGTNSYSGGTTLTSGTLQASSNSNLGNTSTAITFAGGSLELTTGFTTSARNFILNSSGTVNTDSGVAATFSGIISGATGISFTKDGPGTLTLTGANSYTGPTIIDGGTLALSGSTTLPSNSINLNTSGAEFDIHALSATGFTSSDLSGVSGSTVALGGKALTLNTTIPLTFAGTITGSSGGSITKTGSSTLTLSGTNSYTGGTTLTAGTLQVSSDANLGNTSGSITFNGSGTILDLTSAFDSARSVVLTTSGIIQTDDTSTTSTFSGLFSGAGGLTKSGSGTLALSDTSNNYTGGTTLTAGTLQVSSDANLGNTSGGITFNGSGTILDLTSAFNSARSVDLMTSGTIQIDAGTSTFSGVFSDVGGLTKSGSGTLALSNTNTYMGGTTLTAGTLQVSSDANLGDTSGSITFNGGVLELTSAFDSARSVDLMTSGTIEIDSGTSTFSGVFSDVGGLTKSGTGTLALSNTNTYMGGTTLTGGTLQVSSDANLGDISGGITFNGSGTILDLTSAFDSARPVDLMTSGTIEIDAGTSTFSGVFSDVGGLTKSGSGTLALSNTNTYMGGTTLTAGTLQVSSDANLGDTSGGITFNGGVLELTSAFDSARSVDLMTSGTIEIDSGTSTFSGVFSDVGGLTKSGSGTLVLSNTNTYMGGTTLTAGTLQVSSDANLGDISGSITFNGSGTILDLTSAFNSARSVDLMTSGTIEIDSGTSTFSGVFSDVGGLTKSGSGTLALSNTNTYMGGTTLTAGTLQVSSDANLGDTSGSITFNGSGTILDVTSAFDSARPVVLTTSGIIQTDDTSTTSTFSGLFSGAGGLTKSGSGTLALSDTSNDYTGGTTLTAGTLQVSSDANLGDISGSITFNGSGTILDVTSAFDSARSVDLMTSGTIEIDSGTSTFSGVFSDVGGLTKSGTGTLALSNTNTYMGGTTLTGGTLQVSSDANLGDISGGITFNGSGTILDLTSAFDSARPVDLMTSGTIEIDAGTSTFSGVFSDVGGLTKSGSGTLVLSNTNTYMGGTTLTAGTLQVSSDANLGDTSGGITFNGGVLELTSAFDSARSVDVMTSGTIEIDSGTSTFSGVFSDVGGLTKSGSGTLVLSNTNTYMGGTTLTAGTLQVSSNANLGDISGSITFNGSGTILDLTSAFNSARSVDLMTSGTIEIDAGTSTFSGVFSDVGGLTKSGSGTLALSNTNTYMGGTTLTAGTLQVSSNANLGDISGSITFNGSGTILDLTSAFDSARPVVLTTSGIIQTDDTSTTSTFSGLFSGAGGLTKSGSGTLALSDTSNDYTGGTTLTAGTLQVSSDANLGDISGSITFNGSGTILDVTSAFDSARSVDLMTSGTIEIDSGTSTFSGVFSDVGGLTKSGTGTLALSNTNTYMGGTTLTGGTLQVSSDANLGDISGGITFNGSGTILDLTSAFDSARPVDLMTSGTIQIDAGTSTFSGVFSDVGGLTKSGSGTLALSNTNTYMGGTTLTAGTLQVSSDANLGDTSGGITFNGGVLELTSAFDSMRTVNLMSSGTIQIDSGTSTFSGIFNGAGGLIKSGSGTLSLSSSSNTYMGGTTISDGILQVSRNSNLGYFTGNIVFTGGTLELTSAFDSSRSVVLTTTGTIQVDTGASTFSGIFSGSGGAFTKSGSGSLILTAVNTYDGGTTIADGTLALSGLGQLASTGGVNLSSATATFDISGTSAGATIGDLSGVAGSSIILGAENLTTGTSTALTTFAGVISGVGGSLTKNGSGILQLTGTNTYNGGTTINNGTLALVGTAGLSSSGFVNLTSSGTELDASALTQPLTIGNLNGVAGSSVLLGSNDFTTNVSSASTFSGTISGTSIVTKGGTGALTLGTGGILDGSALNVLMGTFICNGLVNAPTTTISSGATLSGTGTLQNVILNGSIAPGSSIGKVNVGNFTFNPGSSYNVELSPSATDEILATGTVTIDANTTINVFPDPGTYSLGQSFTIIDAAGGVSGTFSQVVSTAARLNFQAFYPPNEVVLTIEEIPFQKIPLTGNAQAAAVAFESLLACCPSDDVLTVSAFLDTATLDQLQCDFDSMQPALFNGIPLAQEATTTAIRTTFTDRLQEIHGTLCQREIEKNHSLWLVAIGNAIKQKSTRDNPACDNGYAGFRGDMQGATLGFDAKPSSHVAIGLGISATHTNVHWRHKLGKSSTNSLLGSLFSTFYNKYVYLDLVVMGAYDHFDAHRNIHLNTTPSTAGTGTASVLNRTAKHKNHGVEFDGHAGIGLTFNRKQTQIRPFANLDYLYLYQNRYKESGAQSIDLRVNGRNAEVLRVEAGLSASFCQKSNGSPQNQKRKFECVEEFTLSYVHEQRYQGKQTKSRFVGPPLSSPFTVDGLWPNRDLFSPGISWMVVFPRHRVSLDLRYNGEFGRRWSNQMGSVELLYRF